MAQPTNTFDTNDAIGIREDLSDMIYNVDPFETPLVSKLAKVSATATYHEWQTDVLDAASATNINVEGDDTIAGAITPTVRLGNYTQIFKKSVTITDTMNRVKRAGRGNEDAYQISLKGKALKTDIEASHFANNARAAGSSTVGREEAGIPTWMTTSTSTGATGADATGDGTDARTDGTQRAFTEAQLKTVLASCWDAGGTPDCIFLGSFNKQNMSGFTGNGTRFDKAEDKTLHTSVEVYVSDFGMIKIIPSRNMRTRDALVLQTNMWAQADLRPMKQVKLAKTGDAEKYHVIAECSIESRNEKSSGGVFDLTTS